MLRWPGLTMLASIVLYVLARQSNWNLPAFPQGDWFFNPFCWQLLFCLGAWAALYGIVLKPLVESRWILYFSIGYLLFALVVTLANFRSIDQMWATIAASFLRQTVPFIPRLFFADDQFWNTSDPNSDQRCRDRHSMWLCLLRRLIERRRQAHNAATAVYIICAQSD
jgi:hypothetical protein